MVYPKGNGVARTDGDGNSVSAEGFMSVYLDVADDDASLPSGWSHHAEFSLTLVNQTDEKCNVKGDQTSQTFKAGNKGWGYTQFIVLAALNDTAIGYIVNDTLIIQCDMTNISSDVSTAATAAATPTARVAVPAVGRCRLTR